MNYKNKFLKSIYYNSPYWSKCLMASSYAIKMHKKKYNHDFKKISEQIISNQFKSRDELEAIQREKLIGFVDYAVKNVPYYANLLDDFSKMDNDIKIFDILKSLPVLKKHEIRESLNLFRSTTIPRRELISVQTSGTTGSPLHLELTQKAFAAEYAFQWLHRSWAGIKQGMRIAVFQGHPVVSIKASTPPFWVYDRFENQFFFSSYHLNPKNLESYLRKLREFQPHLITGYPSALYLVAGKMLELNEDRIHPISVVTTSETLLAHQRKTIEDAFQCKAFNKYGNTELAGNIVECERGKMHIQLEFSYLEFLDENGSPVEPGKSGRVVCTAFLNYAMPLIRYEIEDLMVPANETCECGRQTPLIQEILGRVEDYVLTPDERQVGRLDHIFKMAKHVREAQIVQKSLSEVILRIVPDVGFDEKDKKLILDEARDRLGSNINITFNYTESISRSSNGKFRFVVSELPENGFRKKAVMMKSKKQSRSNRFESHSGGKR